MINHEIDLGNVMAGDIVNYDGMECQIVKICKTIIAEKPNDIHIEINLMRIYKK